MSKYYLNYLDELESEAIFILREVWAQFQNPVILFSGGKDSILVTHLAKKAEREDLDKYRASDIYMFQQYLSGNNEIIEKFGKKDIVIGSPSFVDAGNQGIARVFQGADPTKTVVISEPATTSVAKAGAAVAFLGDLDSPSKRTSIDPRSRARNRAQFPRQSRVAGTSHHRSQAHRDPADACERSRA